jgi:phosphotriesterase-related protein
VRGARLAPLTAPAERTEDAKGWSLPAAGVATVEACMATVQTVLGPIEASKLGFTLSHEHAVLGAGVAQQAYPRMWDWETTERLVRNEFLEAKAGGVDSMIDLSTPDLGRDAGFIRRIAEQSGVQIVVASGLWRDIPRWFWSQTPERIARVFIDEIRNGIEETGILPGVIKVANDAEGVTDAGERVLRGAAIACKETGVPISSHHWAPLQVGRRQAEVLLEAGAPPHLVCIGHSADTTDVEYLISLLNLGVYLSLDRYPGQAPMPRWRERNATVAALVRRGWSRRLMLGHDYGLRLVERGVPAPAPPSPTLYLFVKNKVLPALREDGVTDEQIEEMTVGAPRNFLGGEPFWRTA